MFVRHGHRTHDNNAAVKQRLDGSIIEDYFPHTHLLDSQVEKKGLPVVIVASPYQRTRETAVLIQQYLLTKYHTLVDIVIDPEIGEYLGNQRMVRKEDFHPSTYELRPVRDNRLSEFMDRCRNYQSSLDKWYVSHSYFIRMHLQSRWGKDMSKARIDEFDVHIVE